MEKPKTRILIVEDNPDDEALLMRQLQKAQLDQHVKVIGDGKAALEYLTDATLPSEELVAIFLRSENSLSQRSGSSGVKSGRTIAIRHLPVIVMTSSNAPADLAECQRLGVSSYVLKARHLSDLHQGGRRQLPCAAFADFAFTQAQGYRVVFGGRSMVNEAPVEPLFLRSSSLSCSWPARSEAQPVSAKRAPAARLAKISDEVFCMIVPFNLLV